MSRLRVLHVDSELVLGHWDDMFFQVWRGDAGAPQLRRMLTTHLAYLRGRPTRSTVSMAHVQIDRVRPPDEATRAVIREHGETVTPFVRSSVVVVEASGFAGAVVRGILGGLSLVTNGAKQEVRPSARSGLERLVALRAPEAPPVDLATLVAAYQELCASSVNESAASAAALST